MERKRSIRQGPWPIRENRQVKRILQKWCEKYCKRDKQSEVLLVVESPISTPLHMNSLSTHKNPMPVIGLKRTQEPILVSETWKKAESFLTPKNETQKRGVPTLPLDFGVKHLPSGLTIKH